MPRLAVAALVAACVPQLVAPARATPACDDASVLTLLATDTSTDRSLFVLSTASAEVESRLLLADPRRNGARLLSEPPGGLRSGSSHGPGPFLAATVCGPGCSQPVRWRGDRWQTVGAPIAHDPERSVHFTYDREGAAWASFQELTELAHVVSVSAYRWDGREWESRGHLRVRGVGSPALVPDPTRAASVLAGSGRFSADEDPVYWLPALPAPVDSPGGQVVALEGGAVYLTFDSRLYTTTDGGVTWFRDTWRPWSGTNAGPGTGERYSIDLPPAGAGRELAALWFDERDTDRPRLHPARWSPRLGWSASVPLDLAHDPPPLDHAAGMRDGGWLLLGSCHTDERGSGLEWLVIEPDSAPRRGFMPLDNG